MSLLTRLRKHWRAGIATIVATATLAGGITAAFAGDAGPVFTGKVGVGNGAGVVPGSTMDFGWFYQDSYGSLNDDTVKRLMGNHNWRHQSNGGDDLIHQAVQQAVSQANTPPCKEPTYRGHRPHDWPCGRSGLFR